ncbi:class I SAM-dependent methyltransferase [Microbacterium sp. A82]|uniref:class I SAM-dependent methyltransferase n=1 Tax=Microbacterium sp. A82 TaxID=3450452 RepID=UPI003F3E7907
MEVQLSQRTRASLEYLGSTQGFAGGTLQVIAGQEYAENAVDQPTELEDRWKSVSETLADSAAWSFDRLLTRWVAEETYVHVLPGIEEIRDDVEDFMNVSDDAPGSLTLDPSVDAPQYWKDGFHLTPGGWDGHDLMGAAVDELQYAYILTPGGVGAVRTGKNLHDQRTLTAMEANRDSYSHIVEMGSGTGRYTRPLRRTYPDAKLTAIELSTSSLRYARALAAELGYDIDWVQAAAENTGLPDASADLVTYYTLIHEVPMDANLQIMKESFRILEPGGEILIGEVGPYAEQSAFRTVVLDWETENRGEPFWRAALLADLPALLESVGFTDIQSYGLDGGTFPWVTKAVKPL